MFIMTTEYFYCKELTFKAHQSFHIYLMPSKICQNFISIDYLNFTRKTEEEGLCLQATELVPQSTTVKQTTVSLQAGKPL